MTQSAAFIYLYLSLTLQRPCCLLGAASWGSRLASSPVPLLLQTAAASDLSRTLVWSDISCNVTYNKKYILGLRPSFWSRPPKTLNF